MKHFFYIIIKTIKHPCSCVSQENEVICCTIIIFSVLFSVCFISWLFYKDRIHRREYNYLRDLQGVKHTKKDSYVTRLLRNLFPQLRNNVCNPNKQ